MNAKPNSHATARVHSPPKNMMEYSSHLQSRREFRDGTRSEFWSVQLRTPVMPVVRRTKFSSQPA